MTMVPMSTTSAGQQEHDPRGQTTASEAYGLHRRGSHHDGRHPGDDDIPAENDGDLLARLLAASRSNAGALLHRVAGGRTSEAMAEYQAAINIRVKSLRAEEEGAMNPADDAAEMTSSKSKKGAYQEAVDRERGLLAQYSGTADRTVDLFRREASEKAMDEPPPYGDGDAEAQQHQGGRLRPFADLRVAPPLLLSKSDVLLAAAPAAANEHEGGGDDDDDDSGNNGVDSAAPLLNMALWHAERAREAATAEVHRGNTKRAETLLGMALEILPGYKGVVAVSATATGDRLVVDADMRAAESCISTGFYNEYVASWQQQGVRNAAAQAQQNHPVQGQVAAPPAAFAQDQDQVHNTSSQPQTLPSIYWSLLSTVHSTLGKIYLSSDPSSSKALSHLARAWIVARLSLNHLPAASGEAAAHSALVVSALSDLGHAHYRRGELAHAMSACRASLHLLHPLPADAPDIVDRKQLDASRILHNMATIHHLCGQHGPALSQYSAFLGLHAARDDLKARTLHRVGRLYKSAGDSPRAAAALWEAVELTSQLRSASEKNENGAGSVTRTNATDATNTTDGVGANEHPSLVPILDDLGSAYLDANSPGDALRAYRRALAVVQATSGPRSSDAAAQLCNVGRVYFLSGYFGEAVNCFREALDVIEDLCPRLDDDEEDDANIDGGGLSLEEALNFQIHLLNHLGTAQLESGNAEGALSAFQEAEEQEGRALRLLEASALAAPPHGSLDPRHQEQQRRRAELQPAVDQTRMGAAMARARLPVATSVDILALMGMETNHTAPAA